MSTVLLDRIKHILENVPGLIREARYVDDRYAEYVSLTLAELDGYKLVPREDQEW